MFRKISYFLSALFCLVFNKSQTDKKIIEIYKGEYDNVVNASIAAVRVEK